MSTMRIGDEPDVSSGTRAAEPVAIGGDLHLKENLAAVDIALGRDEVDAITALTPENGRPTT